MCTRERGERETDGQTERWGRGERDRERVRERKGWRERERWRKRGREREWKRVTETLGRREKVRETNRHYRQGGSNGVCPVLQWAMLLVRTSTSSLKQWALLPVSISTSSLKQWALLPVSTSTSSLKQWLKAYVVLSQLQENHQSWTCRRCPWPRLLLQLDVPCKQGIGEFPLCQIFITHNSHH